MDGAGSQRAGALDLVLTSVPGVRVACRSKSRAFAFGGPGAVSRGVFDLELQAEGLVEAEHDVEVLDGGSRGALAEVVEPGDEAGGSLVVVAEDEEL